MTIKRGNKGLFPYLRDCSPVNIYKGETKLAGWKWQSQSGEVLKFENGYKDVVHVGVDGKSVQDGVPSPDYPIAINSLDKSFDIVSSKSSPSSSATKDIKYDTQTPTLYKTNILLSEPLRSVGDIKDRLFLDSDGLWKVERNVGELILDGNSWAISSGAVSYNGTISTSRYFSNPTQKSVSNQVNEISTHVKHENTIWADTTKYSGISVNLNQLHLRLPNSLLGIVDSDTDAIRTTKYKNYLQAQKTAGTPVTVQYQLATPIIETLSAEQQTKLNNIQSFKGSNYVYTMTSSGILPELHGKMKVKEI